MIRIGIISAYDDEDWESRKIADAARARGAVEILAPVDFGAELDGAERRITVRGEDARGFDLFLTPRAVGDVGDPELEIELYQALATQVPTVNDVAALCTAIDKFKSSWRFAEAGLAAPRVVVAQRLDEARRALGEMEQAVVKPIYGSLGIGIERLEADDVERLAELLARHGSLYLQAYVGGSLADVRAFVVGDRVEAAIARRAVPGEFRANVHQGAAFAPMVLDRESEELAVRASRAVGLDYAGVDLLFTDGGPVLIEVNGTPSFRAVEAATGKDVAQAIVEHALEKRIQGDERKWPRVVKTSARAT